MILVIALTVLVALLGVTAVAGITALGRNARHGAVARPVVPVEPAVPGVPTSGRGDVPGDRLLSQMLLLSSTDATGWDSWPTTADFAGDVTIETTLDGLVVTSPTYRATVPVGYRSVDDAIAVTASMTVPLGSLASVGCSWLQVGGGDRGTWFGFAYDTSVGGYVIETAVRVDDQYDISVVASVPDRAAVSELSIVCDRRGISDVVDIVGYAGDVPVLRTTGTVGSGVARWHAEVNPGTGTTGGVTVHRVDVRDPLVPEIDRPPLPAEGRTSLWSEPVASLDQPWPRVDGTSPDAFERTVADGVEVITDGTDEDLRLPIPVQHERLTTRATWSVPGDLSGAVGVGCSSGRDAAAVTYRLVTRTDGEVVLERYDLGVGVPYTYSLALRSWASHTGRVEVELTCVTNVPADPAGEGAVRLVGAVDGRVVVDVVDSYPAPAPRRWAPTVSLGSADRTEQRATLLGVELLGR